MLTAIQSLYADGQGTRARLPWRIVLVLLLGALTDLTVQARAQPPANDDTGVTHLAQQAENDLHNQRPDLAIAAYQKILSIDPKNLSAHSNLGLAYYLHGDFALAAIEFKIALESKPDLWNIEALCGLSEAATGQNAKAVEHLNMAFQHVDDPPLRLAAGKRLFSLLYEAGDLNRAAAIVAQLQELDPKNIDVLYAAHQVYSVLESRAFLSMAFLSPDAARMYQARGDRMAQMGKTTGAIAAYRAAIARDPHLSGAHFSLGEALSVSPTEADRAQAENEYRKALADNSQDEKAECRLGEIDLQHMDVSGAAQYYKNALELQHDDPDANEGYGMVLLALDSPGEATKYLLRAVQLDPTNAAAYYHLSQASKKAGDPVASKRELQEFLRLKAQRDNLKHTFSDLPLEAARQNSKSQDSQDSSGKIP